MTKQELIDKFGAKVVTDGFVATWNGATGDDPDIIDAFRQFQCAKHGVKMPEMPSLPQRVLNFGKSMLQVAGDALSGKKVWGSEEHGRLRLEVCSTKDGGCEFFDRAEKVCLKCGCKGSFKTRLTTLKCPYTTPSGKPIDKWATVDKGFL
jgi:hypothetical protein